MKARTRFSPSDLKALKAELASLREGLKQLSQHLLNANLEHTRSQFYDSRVRRISDRLFGKLSDVEGLLYDEQFRHARVGKQEMTV